MVLVTAVVSDNALALVSSDWALVLFISVPLGMELLNRKLIVGTKQKMETPHGIALEKLILTQLSPHIITFPKNTLQSNTFLLTILSPLLHFHLQAKQFLEFTGFSLTCTQPISTQEIAARTFPWGFIFPLSISRSLH